jgi:hypothetical protein
MTLSALYFVLLYGTGAVLEMPQGRQSLTCSLSLFGPLLQNGLNPKTAAPSAPHHATLILAASQPSALDI